ncbi:MAG: oxaloacetate decarboxylase [Actinobacteria bacterium]|nr:oxaloacetate decarboxylase [Actinomycetota bacterium]
MQRNAGPGRLRELLAGPEPVLAPGAYDALSAQLVEGAGFGAVYVTGFGTSASVLGRPDIGLLTFSEMVDNARRIAQAVKVPVIADVDDGYGNPLNVIRTVREYEAAGISAVHIEDQVSPKKCGHMEGKQVIEASEMVEKIRAAVEARQSEEFVIIGRTDARAVEGIEVESGKTPPVELERLRELGYRLVIFPISTLLAATGAIKETLARIRSEGSPIGIMDRLLGFGEFTDLIGLPGIQELEERYEDEEARTPR